MAKGGVGFASSTHRAAADSAKKAKRRANVPTTPAIEATVTKIRAKGKPLNEPDPNIDDVKQCWRETVQEMKLVIRDMRARKLQETVKVAAPVRERPVLETIIQVVEETEPAPAPKPSPLPEKVVVIDTEPLLLMPPKIAGYLPSCIEKNYRTVAMVNRQSIRRQYEAETGAKLPEWKPLDVGQRMEWQNVPGKGWTKVKVS